MQENKAYPPQESDVTITFIDGEVKVYRISTGPNISQFLARQIGETGMLVLLDGATTYSIPVGQIREYRIELVPNNPPQ